MRALFVVPNLAAGGAERVLATVVPGLRVRGHDARLVALDGGGPFLAPLQCRGVPVEILRMRHQADMGALVRSATLRRFCPDVVVSHGVSGLYVGRAMASWRRARAVFNDHRQVGFPLPRRQEAMVRLLSRRLDLVVIPAGEQSQVWRDRGCPDERIAVVHNGAEAPVVTDTQAAIRRELGIPERAVVAVVVASLRAEKRVPSFVSAVRRVRKSQPGLVGVVVGDGPERPTVEAAVNGDRAIRLLGHRSDVPRMLKAADVFVLPSDHEASPLAILEAMAAGLPVVATDVGAVRRMVSHGETGLVVPPGDAVAMASALARVAGDRGLRDAMGRAGAALHRRRWDASAMVDGYERVLSEQAARV